MDSSDANGSVSLKAAMTTAPLSSHTYLANLPSDHCLGSGENVPRVKVNRLIDNLSQLYMAGCWRPPFLTPCGSTSTPRSNVIISLTPLFFSSCSCGLRSPARPFWRSRTRNPVRIHQPLTSVSARIAMNVWSDMPCLSFVYSAIAVHADTVGLETWICKLPKVFLTPLITPSNLHPLLRTFQKSSIIRIRTGWATPTPIIQRAVSRRQRTFDLWCPSKAPHIRVSATCGSRPSTPRTHLPTKCSAPSSITGREWPRIIILVVLTASAALLDWVCARWKAPLPRTFPSKDRNTGIQPCQ